MLVICEDCAKKYNVDESRIKGEKARFSCYECGHIIVVKKPESVTPSSEASDESEASEVLEEPEVHEKAEAPETMLKTDEEDMAYMVSSDSLEEQQGKSSPSMKEKGRFASTFLRMTIIVAILVVGGISYYMYLR